MRSRAVIGVTLGDPAGIGPEIAGAALAELASAAVEFRIVGVDRAMRPGRPDAETARLAIAALEQAARLALAGKIDAVVTGPVCKHRLHAAGFPFPGQTEFFAERSGTSNFAMLLTGGRLSVALVTAHLPLRAVPASLNSAAIVRVGGLLHGYCVRRGCDLPRIAVAGLNPHAGEAGALGDEEEKIIAPAVAQLCARFAGCFAGPVSPDTVFLRAVEGEFDAVLSMYHDQGLIPLKLHAFDQGANLTLGLPFVRTSPDHGTAFEIAGRGRARHASMLAALLLAMELIPTQKYL